MYWQYAAALVALTFTTFFLLRDKSELTQNSSKSSQAYKKPAVEKLKIIRPAERQKDEAIVHSFKREKIFPANTDTIAKEIVVTAAEIPSSTQVADINPNIIQPVTEINPTAIITVQKASPKKYKIRYT